MGISRGDEQLRERVWPELSDGRMRLDPADTVIVCAGFEDRALAFVASMMENGSRGFKIRGVEYYPAVEENRTNDLASIALRADAAYSAIRYDRQDPPMAAECLNNVSAEGRLIVDISGMSRLLIAQLVSYVIRSGDSRRTVLVYSEAAEYPPSKSEVDQQLAQDGDVVGFANFISSGVFAVVVVPDLSTTAMLGQPIRLVTFPSFNPTQFAALLSEVQASFVTVIHGIPPLTENSWRWEAIKKLNALESVRNVKEVSASTLDYRETLELLLDLYRDYGASQKIIISPTGSKMQTVAIGIACGFLSDLQVVYPVPRSFPNARLYTSGVRKTYLLSLSSFLPSQKGVDPGGVEAEVVPLE